MKTIGLIAGNGRFPFLVAQEMRRCGFTVAAVGLREETDPALEQFVDSFTWISLGQFQKLIDTLKQAGASQAVMAGQVKHAQLFAGLKLDWRAIKLLGSLVNKKTDTILGAVANDLAKDGIELLPSHDFLRHLLPEKGLITGMKLSRDEQKDVDFGHRIAKSIAGLDIGQTVVVKDRAVVAVESIEGTNECIRRAAKFAGENTVVVKVAKPNQDFRFDVPVIGPDTVAVLAETRVRVMAVEAGVTLLLDRDQLVRDAAARGVTITAI